MSIVVPFGPQHPVLPEPLQLRLAIEDETVVSALPVIGYVHRGLERLAEQKDFQQDTYLIEHICGICSFMHSTTYCTGIEEIMNIEIPERAKYLRVAWSEMHRIHSHLLALGLLADAFGFESLFYQIWRTREHIMDAMEFTTGGRVMLSAACVGGVRKDINEEQKKFVLDKLAAIEADFKEEAHVLLDDYTVKARTVGVGVIDAKTAYERGAVGPTARASGLKMDHRMTGYFAYDKLDFEPVVEDGCDAYARTKVRIREVYQSIDLIRQALAAGDIAYASRLWGRKITLHGIVEHGFQIAGSKLSAPTANLKSHDLPVLPYGVYSGKIDFEGKNHTAILNIGVAPTFGTLQRRVEIHLLDFNGDLYGKELTVALHRFIRPERRFDSPEALKEQIVLDIKSVREDESL